MKDHIPVPVSSLVFGAAQCGSFCYCSTANVSVFSVFVLHWLSAYVHVVFKVFEVWFAWRVVPSLVWTGGSLMLQGCKSILLWQILQCQSQGHCTSSDKFCSANSKYIVPTILTNSAVPIPRTLNILLWQILQCQSQGHCAYPNSLVPIPRTLCLRKFSSANLIRTLCLRKFSSANPKDTVQTTQTNSPMPNPRKL